MSVTYFFFKNIHFDFIESVKKEGKVLYWVFDLMSTLLYDFLP